MRIHLEGLTIQCIPGSLVEQSSIDGLIVFANTWLKPHGASAEQVHEAGGQRVIGACAESGPATLGNVVVTEAFGVPADKLFHCVVVSADNLNPSSDLVRNCILEAARQADELGLRSLALSPLGSFSGDDNAAGHGILQAVATLPGRSRHLNLVRVIVPPERAHEDVSMMIVREASRLRNEKGAA